ncbi:hypothetical protein GGR50DRAFT_284405 [Xylaria sp. CBS 124048]|nr:hypothetical protein GGR50DRAFT_284405 [Xylaria sp. CBS 124048]
MDKKKKLAFQLDTPYSAVSWPQILPNDQETLLELLCSLLSPLGYYRSRHSHPSKGNRAKKRKRREQPDQGTTPPVPPVPEIQSHIDIGLSSVSRCLQTAVSDSSGRSGGLLRDGQAAEKRPVRRFYSVIFVARSGQPNALSCHLPQMTAVASKCQPSQPPTRLVELPRAFEGRLFEALGIPRVSCVGICIDAPNSTALVDFAREHVPVVEIPWLHEASHAEYRAANINTIETVIGARKKMNAEKTQ